MSLSFANPGYLWRLIRREIIQRRMPHGLLGLGYLWPTQDKRIHLHRRFWWDSGRRWPRPLWLIIEAWLWLRWLLWQAVPACWRWVRLLGPVVQAKEGVPISTQTQRVLQLALFWCIPPKDSYRFRLYRAPNLALDYVFDQEIQAYHAWRNKDLGFNQASHQLLQDKARFAECVAAQGISVVPNLARVPKFEPDLAPLRESLHCAGHVFCKMNSGNQGRGAFAAWQVTQGWAGRSYSGAALSDTGAVENAWRQLLLLDDALIQPCLANHPELAPLAGLDELITVRFISQWQDDGAGLACLSAILEVPAGLSKKGQIFYANLPILAETGELRPATQASLTPDGAVRAALERVAYLAGLQPALPGWGELVSASYRAHALFTDVRAIAWDWAITPDGPVLLEGNSGWGLGNLQVLSAIGLLAEEGCAN